MFAFCRWSTFKFQSWPCEEKIELPLKFCKLEEHLTVTPGSKHRAQEDRVRGFLQHTVGWQHEHRLADLVFITLLLFADLLQSHLTHLLPNHKLNKSPSYWLWPRPHCAPLCRARRRTCGLVEDLRGKASFGWFARSGQSAAEHLHFVLMSCVKTNTAEN